ncbi:bestrophin family protein [Shivajiella indica]|uniref:Bestrophin family protein n=1 Tax=Shivajiella indica TaxID=872115 RepID=A0ABW5B5I7_9BACT
MYVKRNYGLWMTFKWSKKSFLYGLFYSSIIIFIYKITGIGFTLPWEPLSVIGIAVAFYLGFKNNSSYDRTWEARKIWGAIVNDSRTFATAILTLLNEKEGESYDQLKKDLIYRHLAWIISLRYALRKRKSWEHNFGPKNLVFVPTYYEILQNGLDKELLVYLNAGELEQYKTKSNIPSQILKKQAEEIKKLHAEGIISEYKHVWLHQIISKLYDDQGMAERIKNFPLPRQYASVALWITYFFCALIPFGLLDIFITSTELWIWMTIPLSGLIIWIFFLMERIGDYSENPFEGNYNDVPISSITRSIEIDLREMINDDNIPEPFPVENGFLM